LYLKVLGKLAEGKESCIPDDSGGISDSFANASHKILQAIGSDVFSGALGNHRQRQICSFLPVDVLAGQSRLNQISLIKRNSSN
jgi:hypothetical protein